MLESAWKAAPEPERELWRGLAQLAVGLTHAQRGNAVGAVRLLRRAADRVERYANDALHGLDTAGLVIWARALAVRVETDGFGGLTPGDLVPHLRPEAGRTIDVPEHARRTRRDQVDRDVVAVGKVDDQGILASLAVVPRAGQDRDTFVVRLFGPACLMVSTSRASRHYAHPRSDR